MKSSEIATLANVSRSTVSRVLSDHPGVSDKMRKRIEHGPDEGKEYETSESEPVQPGSNHDAYCCRLPAATIPAREVPFLADYCAPERGILSTLYVFTDWGQCRKSAEADWWTGQEGKLAESGLHMAAANWILVNATS